MYQYISYQYYQSIFILNGLRLLGRVLVLLLDLAAKRVLAETGCLQSLKLYFMSLNYFININGYVPIAGEIV